jgi:acetyl esterase/lipase
MRTLVPSLCLLFACGGLTAQEPAAGRSRVYPPKIPEAAERVYKSVQGVDLRLWILAPQTPAAAPRPGVVFFFGGGWAAGTPSQFERQARHFAGRGLVAVLADYRVKSRNQTRAADAVADARDAVRWLRAHAAEWGLDPDRLAAAGGSAGGHLAACTATLPDPAGPDAPSSRPNALLLFNPALVLAPLPGLELKGFGTGLDADRLGAEPAALSPAHHVRPGTAPTLILHGTEDRTVPFSTAEAFAREMQRAGNRCQLVPYPGQGHGFFNDGHFEPTLKAADAFLVELGWLPAP